MRPFPAFSRGEEPSGVSCITVVWDSEMIGPTQRAAVECITMVPGESRDVSSWLPGSFGRDSCLDSSDRVLSSMLPNFALYPRRCHLCFVARAVPRS